MPIQGQLLEAPTTLEVVSAYGVPKIPVPSQSASPGWFVVGGFYLERGVAGIHLEVIGMVNHASLTMNCRLFNVSDRHVVSGSQLSISDLTLVRSVSGSFDLEGLRIYQVQAEAIGANQYDRFGGVHTASITDL